MKARKIRNRVIRRNATTWAIAAAACAAIPATGHAQIVITGNVYSISTSGSTALGSLVRMNSNANTPASGTIFRGMLALGQPTLTIGNTTYNLPAAGIQYLGISNLNGAIGGEPTAAQDQLNYYYRETGSVQGILDVASSQGLQISAGGAQVLPGDPQNNNFVWQNGSRFTSRNSVGTPDTGRYIGQNYDINGVASPGTFNGAPGLPYTQIAWSDVRFEQAFSISGGASGPASTPTSPGYGLGAPNLGGTNYQRLAAASAFTGGIAPATTRLRNESVAVVPFNLVANPGTGLAHVTTEDGKWLQATGRLQNGANFNSVTREFGSGTRNQGTLNFGLDPSWGGGERDRRSLNASPVTTTDADGNPVTINQGDEMNPQLNLNGGTVQDINENRIGPAVRFSDKIAGGAGVRPTVVASRMGVGILSAGDSRDGSNGTALANVAISTAVPLRALAIDFHNSFGFQQGTAFNVTEGKYGLWSAAQAVTVSPYADPNTNDTGANVYKPIVGDVNDAGGGPTSNAQPGIVRKFLNNLTGSVSTYTTDPGFQSITPADFLVTAAFIPPQIMGVTKTGYDGSTLNLRTRSAADPDGAGPQVSEQSLWANAVQSSSGVLYKQTDWANPSTMNGDLTGSVKYKIFASSNNTSTATANRLINVTTRTNLAGDFNGDSIRDKDDVAALALAYANPATYLTTPTSGESHGWNYNGTAVNSASSGTNAAPADGLIVLSDFNSNGNVTVDQNNGAFATTTIERPDVKYFLWGATVDTQSANANTGYTGSSDPTVRREDGVRLGQLKKNAAIDTFNSTLDTYAGVVINPATGVVFTAGELNALKFEKRDTNGDGVASINDALIVDKFFTQNLTDFTNQTTAQINRNGTVDPTSNKQTPFDLVYAELNDDNLINASDMTVMNQGLTGVGNESWSGSLSKAKASNIVVARTGGTITVTPGATLAITGGSFTVNGTVDPLTDSTAAPGDTTKSLAVTVGTATLEYGARTGLGSDTGKKNYRLASLAVQNGGLVKLDANLNQNDRSILATGAITFAGTGKIDLTNNELLTATADATVRASIITNQIFSSTAGGVLGHVDQGGGITEVRWTLSGDSNLDGKVDVTDLGNMASSYGLTGGAVWVQGDTNYDNNVDVTDLGNLATNYGGDIGGGPSAGDADGMIVSSLAVVASTGAAVPEPTALGLIGIGAVGLGGRRRRRA